MQLDLSKLKQEDSIRTEKTIYKSSKPEWFLFIFISILITMYALFTEFDSELDGMTNQSK